MKTKRGSCNREIRHLWFGSALARRHLDSLEYIVVHQMTCHLRGHHDRHSSRLIDGFMPGWGSRCEQLSDASAARKSCG